ncbi:CPBP family intramembrane glutamic endopeptidase [Bacillus sp. FJAT-29814]|uniref:CPBP family intramembrane glutamic endopeptidase n=1 Tax=Bacillus sp. FJAT-29814 TaxID=1729688 RepID=UPI000833B7C9|nr:type II CAAX endopeptidase family protein [Bacillus sp. FJAT-29814]
MQNKKVYSFILINFLITWGCWLAVIFLLESSLSEASPEFVIYGLGGLLGPVVAAVISQRFYGSKVEFRQFLTELVKVKVNIRWYIFVLIVPLLLGIFPFLIDSLFTGKIQMRFDQPYYAVLLMLPMMILGGGLEEVGWRGVLLPEFLKKFTPFTATLLLSVIWAVWHVPLWFISGTAQHGSNFGLFFVSVMGTAIVLSALYIRTKSIWMCILLHALFNANSAFFASSGGLHAWNETVSVIVKLVVCIGLFMVLLKGRVATIRVSGGVSNARH